MFDIFPKYFIEYCSNVDKGTTSVLGRQTFFRIFLMYFVWDEIMTILKKRIFKRLRRGELAPS